MTGFFKGKGVSQIDSILINSQVFHEEQIKAILKDIKADKIKKKKKK